jgi:hypothetical protein
VHASVVSYSTTISVVSSFFNFFGNWIVNAEPYGSWRLARVYFNALPPETMVLIFRKDVSKVTWSTSSAATRKCLTVPEMIPGCDGVVGKLIFQSRAIDVVRMAR